jgi:hypothetical protein
VPPDPRDRLLNDKPWQALPAALLGARGADRGAIVVGLALVSGWVVWMGAHPDPELFSAPPAQASRAPATTDRGPVPEDLTAPGWSEDPIRSFGPDNLYEKINGREGYYKTYGFRALHFVALSDGSGRSIDVELYDLGTPQNALGAYAGELDPEAKPEWDGGFVHYTSNALFMTRGPFYARALGSERSDEIRAQLEHLQARLRATLPAGELPGAYGLFARALGIGPARVSFAKENAFSFGFAEGVWIGLMADEETEVFVDPDPTDPDALVRRYREGFASYGEAEDATASTPWFVDRYLGRASGVRAVAGFVVGVRSAESSTAGAELLERFASAVAELEPGTLDPPPEADGAEPGE